MRKLVFIGICLLASFANAERLLFIPTGDKLRNDQIQFESWASKGNFKNRISFVGIGILDSMDFELRDEYGSFGKNRTSFDFSYNFFVPFPDVSPGISLGVQDILGNTQDGRSIFLAATWKINQDSPLNANSPIEVTLGGGTGRYRGAFFGARMPFTDGFRLLTEHDSRKLRLGFEIVPLRDLKVLWMTDEQTTSFGANYSVRF